MSVTDRIGSAIKAAAGLAALAPGVAMLLGVVDVPPTATQLTKALSLSAGVIVILGVLIARRTVQRTPARRMVLLCGALLVIGTGLALAYFELGETYVIEFFQDGRQQQVVLPLDPSDELQAYVEELGSYPEAMVNLIVGRRVQQLIEIQNDLTVPTLVLLVLLAQTALLIATVAGAWKFAASLEDQPSAGSSKPEPAAPSRDRRRRSR